MTKKLLTSFFQNDFRIGISIDGTREHNDRHRVFHNGKSSYDETVKAIELIKSFSNWKKIFGGLLVRIDIRNKPEEILDAIAKLDVHSAKPTFARCTFNQMPLCSMAKVKMI